MSANKVLFIVVVGAILCLFAVLYVPFFADLFRLAPLGIKDFLLIGIVVFVSLAWFEVLKLLRNEHS